jgi:hypothetical protein
MKLSLNASGVLAVAGIATAGYLGWKAYKTGANVVDTLKQAADQVSANVSSAWANNVSGPFQQGRDYANGIEPFVSSKAWLYSDYAYTGQQGGQLITGGEWFGDEEARRYEVEQLAAGAMPAGATITPNGAAFGIYPRP